MRLSRATRPVRVGLPWEYFDMLVLPTTQALRPIVQMHGAPKGSISGKSMFGSSLNSSIGS